MQQYFKVGEEVILKSRDTPSLNGDHVVDGVKDGVFKGREGEYKGFVYSLTGVITDIIQPDGKAWFPQRSLRKKHKPGESMDSIISSIKDCTPA